MKRVLLAFLVCVAACGQALWGQDQSKGYHRVSCFKVNDGKWAEYRQFQPVSVKLMQALADSGEMTAWFRLRGVLPRRYRRPLRLRGGGFVCGRAA